MADANSPPELLDPFTFPSETDGRFRMLLAAALALAWSLGAYFIEVPNGYTLAFQVTAEEQAVLDKLKDQDASNVTLEDISRIRYSEAGKRMMRMAAHQLVRLALSIVLVLFLVAATTFLYRRHAAHLRRLHQTRPLSATEAPTVLADLRRCVARACLPSEMRFEWKPGFLDGLAFGRRGREVVVINGHPRFLERSWNPLARAVVLHELGHIANGDIRNREVTRALWRVLTFLVVFLGGVFAVVSAVNGRIRFPLLGEPFFPAEDSSPLQELLGSCLKTAAIFLTTGWIWAELIRVREFYADWRVAAWGLREPLLRRLRLPASQVPPWFRFRIWRALRSRWGQRPWWRSCERWSERLWDQSGRHHPTNARRAEVLQNPASLFRVTPELAFLSGLLVTILFGQLAPLFTDLTFLVSAVAAPAYLVLGPFALLIHLGVAGTVTLVITRLVTGALGVQAQREAAFDLATRHHSDWGYLRLFKPALLFAVGLEVGLLLTPWGGLKSPFETLIWLAGFTTLIWLWFLHLRAISRLWLGSHAGERRPEGTQRLLSWTATVLLGALLWPALVARLAIHLASESDLLLALTPAHTPPQVFLVNNFVMTSIVLFVVGLVCYLAAGFISLLTAGGRIALRRRRCTTCGEPVPPGLVIGQKCRGCDAWLASWLYLEPPKPAVDSREIVT